MGKAKTKKKATKQNLYTILKRWWLTKHPFLIFSLIFGVLVVLFYIGINTTHFKTVLHPALNNWYASIGSTIINWFGFATTVKQSLINSTLFSVDIERGCDALEPIGFFISAVLAYPVSFSKKWIALLFGPILLALLNILRIVTLYFTGVYFKSVFDIIHVDVWQVVFILLTMGICLIWIKWATSTN